MGDFCQSNGLYASHVSTTPSLGYSAELLTNTDNRQNGNNQYEWVIVTSSL